MTHPFKPGMLRRLELCVQIVVDGGGGGGGGGGGSYPFWSITPTTFSFGNVTSGGGSSKAIPTTIKNVGQANLTVSGILISGTGAAAFSTGFGVLPRTIAPGATYTFNITFTPAANQAYSATIKFTTNDPYSPHSYALSGTGVSNATPQIQLTQAAYNFPDTKINTSSANQPITAKNTGAVTVHLSAWACTNQYVLSSLPALPFTLAPGASVTAQIKFSPNVTGSPIPGQSVSILTQEGAGDGALLVGNSYVIIPVSVLPSNIKRMFLGFNDPVLGPNLKYITSPIAYNSDQPTTLVFNGTIFKKPSVEKTVLRVWVAYENLGVCTLTLELKVWRPQLNNGAGGWDSKTSLLQLGDASADGSERTGYFDLENEGEIIVMTITRAASSGPMALISLIPEFVPAGEKVEGV